MKQLKLRPLLGSLIGVLLLAGLALFCSEAKALGGGDYIGDGFVGDGFVESGFVGSGFPSGGGYYKGPNIIIAPKDRETDYGSNWGAAATEAVIPLKTGMLENALPSPAAPPSRGLRGAKMLLVPRTGGQ